MSNAMRASGIPVGYAAAALLAAGAVAGAPERAVVKAPGRAGQHDRGHRLRPTEREPEDDEAAQRVADDGCPVDPRRRIRRRRPFIPDCFRQWDPTTPMGSRLPRTEAASTCREAILAMSSRSSSPPRRSSGGSRPAAGGRTIPRCPRTARASSCRPFRRTRSRCSTPRRASSPDPSRREAGRTASSSRRTASTSTTAAWEHGGGTCRGRPTARSS